VWEGVSMCRRTIIDVRAVMVGFNGAGGVRGIDVKCVDMRAKILHGGKLLCERTWHVSGRDLK
jgi:hypothetical protein